ncbi:hypothetical protein, conserved [Trypanosoma cruzi]|uniref:Uncharacterized protein n=1 Tax=Trypanosoma cruzi (strain CL Brener) TaxID=353153 RepID=Q4DNV0_TRYCC|nr:hypothetical protein, conserved [Trypanosoma cruzi]EAN94217.1 hypothetical protein, conserved [Trypanosoma cruzi]|eukprot:XP_816068.1 hypothetical protein [Trypanosoma cruzi strain CL Brener]
MDYRDRVIALYQCYAPEKMAGVDAQLSKYEGREEEFIQAIINKYGPEPDSAEGIAENEYNAQEGEEDEWYAYYRQRLVNFYTIYASEKIDSVDNQLKKYAGREEPLFEALVAKYGPEPEYENADENEKEAADKTNLSYENVGENENKTGSKEKLSYRDRVVALYNLYVPSKLGDVDAQLEKYRGREEEFIAALEQKYGPEPSVAESASADYRSRVVSIYERYAPGKLGDVDAQLEKYRGHEEEFIAALEQKYGPEPSIAESASADYRSRVVSIYERYAPGKLGDVDAQLEKYRGHEEEFIAALEQKYGPEPSVAESASADYRSRVVSIYERYAPGKLGDVDAQLEKYRGHEEEFIAALEQKYGPEPSIAESASADYRSRVVSIYERYAPGKLGDVDAQLEKYRGHEEEFIAALEQKYGPEPSVAESASADYRSRVVSIYERYAPGKLGDVDAQLEKYRGREEEFIAALEQKYVYGSGSALPSLYVSGTLSPVVSEKAGSSHQMVLMGMALTTIMEEESARRLELLEAFTAGLMSLSMDAESERRLKVEHQEQLAAAVFEEFFIRLQIIAEEAMGRPVLEHPHFPFVSDKSADAVARFFAALGTTHVNGKAFIMASACRLLFFEAVGEELLEEPQGELVSLEEFRQLLTRACHCEKDVVARLQSFVSMAKRQERPTVLAAPQELCAGFWAYRCVKPCVAEDWQRVWVVLENDTRLVIRRPNIKKPELTIPVGQVIKCQLSSMLGTQAPRSCAKNGLYLQLSSGVNPVLLLLCPQRVANAQALVKMFFRGVPQKTSGMTRDVVAEAKDTLMNKGEVKISAPAAGEICRTEDACVATIVWCCRGGCSKFVRSVWTLVGDSIVHQAVGEKENFTWGLATVRDVYLVNELGMRPPVPTAKHGFVVLLEKGSLFCCTETAAARDAIVGYMKRVVFKHFLQSNQKRASALTSLMTEESKEGKGGAPLASAKHRVPGVAHSSSRR